SWQYSQVRVIRRVLARFFRSLHEGTSPSEISRPRRGCRPTANQPGAVGAMNPIVFAMRRPVTTLLLVVALGSRGVLGLANMQPHRHHDKIVVTSPKATDVILTQRYVCRIHAHHHINVRALETGYLEEISVKEGQVVKKGDSLFKIKPAKANLAEAKWNFAS